ncbi:MAG: 50S ribosomal protein L19 [Candidatus Magasanikbacteria bacterium]|nr:50S ribosomal protein L19 [Candidatus Magasanikbacteria bacterium]
MSEDIRQNLKSGMIIKVHQKIREKNAKGEEKERIQLYEGMIIAVKHGNGPSSTITVRKMSKGFGVEKIFPVHSPVVEKIELVRQMRVNRAKGFFLRDHKKKLREVKKKGTPTVKKQESKKVESQKEEKPKMAEEKK